MVHEVLRGSDLVLVRRYVVDGTLRVLGTHNSRREAALSLYVPPDGEADQYLV